MDTRNNTTELRYSIPKSGYGFLEALLDIFKGHSAALAAILEKPHRLRGRRGYPAHAMLCVYLLQFLIPDQRYSSHYLRHLYGRPRLLAMCGLDAALSEYAYCRFKKKLAGHRRRLRTASNRTIRDLAAEIESLRELGIIPENAPRLGEVLAMDATDIVAYARERPEHCDDPDKEKCTKKHKYHCDSPDKDQCTKHKPCADPDAHRGYRTPKGSRAAPAARMARTRKNGTSATSSTRWPTPTTACRFT